MKEPNSAAGEHSGVAQPLEIKTFYSDEAVPRAPAHRGARPLIGRTLRDYRGIAIALFLATCLSVFLAGFEPGGGFFTIADACYKAYLLGRLPELIRELRPEIPVMLKNGGIYFAAVMTILVAHEMGHYLQSRRYKVPATFPFFIPFPISPFGTMGAVIIQGPGVADRKSLFDIAISGPLAGLVFAIPITLIGLSQAHVDVIHGVGTQYGDPLLLKWLARLYFGPIPEDHDVILNPWLFAGWVGIFITALNLIPIGQLDGGHILYTLIGRRAHPVAMLLLALALTFMIVRGEFAYGVMVALLFLSGPRHPPTANDHVPLGIGRIVLGWLTLAFVIVGFTPVPITMPTAPPQQERHERPAGSSQLYEVQARRSG
ncbi:MAG TPA: site-2 protease family protein, partial [Planctomycetaceae bacterium]|nr:site-2 protease family protein [Planctomycetaceae bacterium]